MKDKKKKDDYSGIAVPAFLLMGIGYGFLVGNLVAWTMLGLGFGFLVMLIIQAVRSKRR